MLFKFMNKRSVTSTFEFNYLFPPPKNYYLKPLSTVKMADFKMKKNCKGTVNLHSDSTQKLYNFMFKFSEDLSR